eukprot:TRINITY_DN19016_c0_g1_i2.p1 TRINITY_DN19016_c0_g1~~TRINITY_DN19016_c0_g1_i2.p1  ORF type:complete len:686 (+),score=142.41 TRINITY_DN19016_c0_g1_i2:98-2155(+)
MDDEDAACIAAATFMNVLCGKATYGKMGGAIKINGERADISQLKSVLGFVPQDDIVHEDLSVREQIEFSARLRCSKSTDGRRVKLITDDVLNVMQIDHIQNSIVGGVTKRGISGGQRKRVNIGLELAANPTVLFLDEPTSGLDSTSSLSVALSLKKMCELGMTSIMVIHQPRYSLFTLFDDVLLLGKGGQTVYLGPSTEAKSYFENLGFSMPADENPSDWFMDVISGEVANSRIADFQPQQLFGIWERGEHRPQPKMRAQAMRTGGEYDETVLRGRLEEEWNKSDWNRDGYLQEDELKTLLMNCTKIEPDDSCVHELFTRMAGTSATKVTKDEFMGYLKSLAGTVATDAVAAEMSAQSSLPLEEIGSDDSEESYSDSSDGERTPMVVGMTAALSSHVPVRTIDKGLIRRTPGFARQLKYLFRRRIIQWWRMNDKRMLFICALGVGAVVLGVMDRYILEAKDWDAMSFLNTHTCVALLIAIFCLSVFGSDQPVFWRESSCGLNTPAFFMSRVWINFIDVMLQTSIFAAVYFLIRQPRVKFRVYVVPFYLVAFVASGWGYAVSTWLPPAHGPFIVSLIIFVVCGLMGNPQNLINFLDGGSLEVVASTTSITRWSVAMNFNYQVESNNPQPKNPTHQNMLAMEKMVFEKGMWDIGYWYTCVIALLIMGFVMRVIALVGLAVTNRDKRV